MASEILKFESVDDDDDGRRRTDDGPLVYYKLTLSAFGLGELIKLKHVKEKDIQWYEKNGLETNKVHIIFVCLRKSVKNTFILSDCM